MPTVVIFTRLVALPGRRRELAAAFEPLHDAAGGEAGTLVFAMHEARDAPDTLLFYEVYEDEAALGAHRDSPAVAAVVEHLGALLAEAPAVTYSRPLRSKGMPPSRSSR